MKDLTDYLMFNEASALSNNNVLISEEETGYGPEQVLNNKYKNFKELIEALAKYFGVKVPDIRKKDEIKVHLYDGSIIRRYYDVEYVVFDLKNNVVDVNQLTVIDNAEGKYPIFVLFTNFVKGKLRPNGIPLSFTYGEIPRGVNDTRNERYKYKKDKFYDWCPNDFKEWLKNNQK